MTYHTVFDAATDGFRAWPFVGVGLVITAVGAALVFAPSVMEELAPGGLQGSARKVFSWVFFLFALTLLVLVGVANVRSYLEVRSASLNASCTLVSGVVSNFVPMPYGGHAMESFTVGEVPFEFSNYVMTSGFNNTQSHGGPIRQGLPVEICYIEQTSPNGNVIVRLKVAD